MYFQGFQKFVRLSLLIISISVSEQYPQQNLNSNEVSFKPKNPGHYVPEIFNARAKYTPDYSGLYKHMHIPYDGGFGDRGSKYQHDEPKRLQAIRRPFSLGPKDHLRFMIDFNYNGTGWQVIQFEWIHDDEAGDQAHHYNYVNENRCCGQESEVSATTPHGLALERDDNNSEVHVKGEYDQDYNNVTYSETKMEDQTPYSPSDIHLTINEVLEYIQTNIIPNLA